MPTFKIVDLSGNVLLETRSWPQIQQFFEKLRDDAGVAGFDAALRSVRMLSYDYLKNTTVYADSEIKYCVLGMPREA